MKKYLVSVSILLLLVVFGPNINASSQTTTIEIVHTNDVHGHASVWPYVKGLADSLRTTNSNVSIVDAGDSFAGTPFASLSNGLDVAKTMNAVGYEMMTIGNHEYAMNTETLKGVVQASNFPFLGINVEQQTPGLLTEIPEIKGYIIKEYSGIKVAFLGITTSMSAVTSTGQTQGEYRVALAEQLRSQAAKEGANIFIALAHLGDTDPEETMRSTYLADHCPWLTAIIDGHSHSEHPNGFVRNGVLVAQTGEYGNNIGVMTITVDEVSKKTIGKSDRLIKVKGNEENTGIKPDPTVQGIVDEVNNKNEAYLSEVLFTTPVELIGEKPLIRSQETNFGNITADAYREAGKADIAFAASVTIRQNIAAGPVTREVLLSSLGSEQRLLKYEISGQKLWNIMENSLSIYPEITNYFQQVSGITVQFDPTKEPGKRIYSIALSNGKKIDLAKTYSLVIREDMPAMTDITGELDQLPFIPVGMVYPDFIKYAQVNAHTFKSGTDNRLVVVDIDALKAAEKEEPSGSTDNSNNSNGREKTPENNSINESATSSTTIEKNSSNPKKSGNNFLDATSSREEGRKKLPSTGTTTSLVSIILGIIFITIAILALKNRRISEN